MPLNQQSAQALHPSNIFAYFSVHSFTFLFWFRTFISFFNAYTHTHTHAHARFTFPSALFRHCTHVRTIIIVLSFAYVFFACVFFVLFLVVVVVVVFGLWAAYRFFCRHQQLAWEWLLPFDTIRVTVMYWLCDFDFDFHKSINSENSGDFTKATLEP